MTKKTAFLLLITSIFLVFYPLFLKGQIPVPADALVGLFNPFRDYYSADYPNGIPYKNYLITDPVRQIIPWKKLGLETLSKGKIPLWNPYSLAGTPLLGNVQSSVFYPLNLILLSDFMKNWGFFIFFQPLLGAVFMYVFLRSLKLGSFSSMAASFAWVFCGYFTAWMEWGNIIHSAIWLPLLLFFVNKLFESGEKKEQDKNKLAVWLLLILFSLTFSFFAGHLQTFFYLGLFGFIYAVRKLFKLKQNKHIFTLGLGLILIVFLLITAVQWYPFLKFVKLSARSTDIVNTFQRQDWFFPWQHLSGFLAPDFFGNPATQNYWGIWNYGEFSIYIGVFFLLFSIYGMLNIKKQKEIKFFMILGLIFINLALPTPWAKIPFIFKIPLLSTAQPSRIIFLVEFCLIVLSAFGLSIFNKKLNKGDIFHKKFVYSLLILILGFVVLWTLALTGDKIFSSHEWSEKLAISRRNLIFPSMIFAVFIVGAIFLNLIKRIIKGKKLLKLAFLVLLLSLSFADLCRFFHKFNPFTDKKWFYPQTDLIKFLKQDNTIYRIATTDRRILPGNVSAYYKIQAINGYDPLYLKNYAEYITASERGRADIKPPYGFNRLIEPQNINSPLINLLNVKYVLGFKDLDLMSFKQVFAEGETIVYENKNAYPRVYLVDNFVLANDKNQVLKYLFDQNLDLKKTAVLYNNDLGVLDYKTDDSVNLAYDAEITDYSENQIILNVNTNKQSILVLSEVYYPSWQATINNKKTEIIPVNYLFRGIVVPKGEHKIVFSISL
jgi:hypothetical protein